MEIGVVGGAGGMGHWIAAFLQRNGYTPHLIDTDPSVHDVARGIKCVGIHASDDVRCLLTGEEHFVYDVLVIAVPLDIIPSAVSQYAPLLKPSSLLMDIGSLKVPALQAMETWAPEDVYLLPTHPLFGTRFESFAGLTCVVTTSPAKPAGPWGKWWKDLVLSEKGSIVEATAPEHDEMMLTVQVLVHYIAITIGETLRKSGVDLNRLQSFKTPPFETLASVVGRLFSAKRKNVYWNIQQHPDGDAVRSAFAKVASEMAALLSKADIAEFSKKLESIEDFIGASLGGYSHNADRIFSHLAAGQRALFQSKGGNRCIVNVGSKNKAIHYGRVEEVDSETLVLRTRKGLVSFSTKNVRVCTPQETIEWVSANLPLQPVTIVIHCHKVVKPKALAYLANTMDGVRSYSILDVYDGDGVPADYNKITLLLNVIAEPHCGAWQLSLKRALNDLGCQVLHAPWV